MSKKWDKALDQVRDDHIEEAAGYRRRRPVIRWVSAVAAVLAVVIAWTAIRHDLGASLPPILGTEPTAPTVVGEEKDPLPAPGTLTSPHLLKLNNMTAGPKYPQQEQCPKQEDYADEFEFSNAFSEWEYQQRAQRYTPPEDYVDDLQPFFEKSMKQFLSGEGNQVCSPANIYLALAMLAEVSGGSSRQQVLDLLGHSSLESLRTQAKQLWNAHYLDDGQTASLLANSLWLDEEYTFKEEAVNALVEHYFASVFQGDLGTPEMTEQLAAWLDAQTGGLLSEHTGKIEMDPVLTAFCLASTAYFSAGWDDEFSEAATTQEVFHCEGFDLTTDFMHQRRTNDTYYTGKDFSAVQLGLSGNHSMWLILPDEDSSPAQVLEQGDYYELITDPGSWDGQKTRTVNLSLPKFDIDCEQNLIPGLKAMGITDVFDENAADYTPISDQTLALSSASHAARVAVDEEGVIAAAYTLMVFEATGMPMEAQEIDFTLDRPFLFAITGTDEVPLFAGVVAQP